MQCVHIPEHTKPLIMLNGYWGSQQYEQQDHLWGRHFPPCINIPIINKNPTGIWSVSVSQAGVNQQHKCGLWGVLQANLHINCSALQQAEREVGFRVVAGERLICREKEKRFKCLRILCLLAPCYDLVLEQNTDVKEKLPSAILSCTVTAAGVGCERGRGGCSSITWNFTSPGESAEELHPTINLWREGDWRIWIFLKQYTFEKQLLIKALLKEQKQNEREHNGNKNKLRMKPWWRTCEIRKPFTRSWYLIYLKAAGLVSNCAPHKKQVTM